MYLSEPESTGELEDVKTDDVSGGAAGGARGGLPAAAKPVPGSRSCWSCDEWADAYLRRVVWWSSWNGEGMLENPASEKLRCRGGLCIPTHMHACA